MPATVMRHPSWCPPQPPHLDCPCGCGGRGECHREPCVPDCGDRPPWGWWGWKMRQSWQDVRFLEKTIKEVVADMVKDGTLGVDIPIKGVQDGSDAAPGMVGEFIQASVTGTYTAAEQTQPVSVTVMPPGDWNCFAVLRLPGAYGANFLLDPKPAGASNDMIGWLDSIAGAGGTVPSLPARLSIAQPTLIAFTLHTNYFQAGGSTGDFEISWEARRMR